MRLLILGVYLGANCVHFFLRDSIEYITDEKSGIYASINVHARSYDILVPIICTAA